MVKIDQLLRAFREASILFEEIFIRLTLGETVNVMKQNEPFLCGPFTKEA